jgi:FkbM family methyltransferase
MEKAGSHHHRREKCACGFQGSKLVSTQNGALPVAGGMTGSAVRLLVRGLTALSAGLSYPEWLSAVVDRLSVEELGSFAAKRLNALAEEANAGPPSEELVAAFEHATGAHAYYGQEGEDIFLLRLYGEKRDGFFVDVGAHHPLRFSNTYALYRRGWRGVNIDATPGSMALFRRYRPDDTNIECAVSDRAQEMSFHVFKEGALNTFDSELAKAYVSGGHEQTGTVELNTRPLAEILDECVKKGQKVDVLSIDVEGSDLAVLRSNDWQKYSPDVVIIEALDTPFSKVHDDPCVAYLDGKGYIPVARLTNSILLRRKDAA